MVHSHSVSNKLARAQVAILSGRLDDYAPAQMLTATDTVAQRSWGPAMRR